MSEGERDKSSQVFHCLTIRQWFAGVALQGLLANKDYLVHIGGQYANQNTVSVIAEQSFEMADAMIKEGEKK